MILVDSSVWVDHIRAANATLAEMLLQGKVVTHPFVIGEIALGSIGSRDMILDALRNLPRVTLADIEDVDRFIEQQKLFGLGIGYVDVHLLASARLTPGTGLWTRDRRLYQVAIHVGVTARL